MTLSFGRIAAEHRDIEERLAREKINRAAAGDPGERRVEVTLVVHRENDRSVLDDAFRMNDAVAKENARDPARQIVTEDVPGTHAAIVRPLSFKRPMISPTTPSIVRFELSMT